MLHVGIISGQPRTAAPWLASDERMRELGKRETEGLAARCLMISSIDVEPIR